MRTVYLIARATFQEAVRRRILNVILIFGTAVIATSWFFSYLQPGAELKMINDVCLGAIRFFGMLITVFMGAMLIPSEIEKKTIHVILSKPVNRVHVILGKFLGAWFTVLVNVTLMSLAFFIVFFIKAPQFAGQAGVHMDFMAMNLLKACLLVLFELLVLASIAVTASTMMSWVVTAVFAFAVYFGGQFSSFIQSLADPAKNPNVLGRAVLTAMYTFLPHFDQFDIREAIVGDQFIPWDPILRIMAYGLMYTVVVMLVGYILFNRREV
jgi:ABC-type transport system involved in multi-copper enzyme maturation permease subunit